MEPAVRELVRHRAENRCEYRLLHKENCELIHHVEHIVAKQHAGTDDAGNLALACHRCNLRKGPNLSGVDPLMGEIVPLYHPRQRRWMEYFRFKGVRIEGLTATGRATVQVLALNDPRRLELRAEILVHGGQK